MEEIKMKYKSKKGGITKGFYLNKYTDGKIENVDFKILTNPKLYIGFEKYFKLLN